MTNVRLTADLPWSSNVPVVQPRRWPARLARWTVPRRGGVVQRERQPLGVLDERLDHGDQESGGDLVRLLVGRRDRRVTGAELRAQAGGADSTGDGPAAAGEHGAEEQKGKPRCGSPVDGGGEKREPLADSGDCRR